MAVKTGKSSETKSSYRNKNYTGSYKGYSGKTGRSTSSGKSSSSPYKKSTSPGTGSQSKYAGSSGSKYSSSGNTSAARKNTSYQKGSSYQKGTSYTRGSSSGKASSYSRGSSSRTGASSYSKGPSSGKASSYSRGPSSGKASSYSKGSSSRAGASSQSKSSSVNYTSRTGKYSSVSKTRSGSSSGRTAARRRSVSQDNFMILKLLVLVCLVLVVFEGRLILTMFTQKGSSGIVTASATDAPELETESVPSEELVLPSSLPATSGSASGGGIAGLAGLAANNGSSDSSSDSGVMESSAADGSISEALSSFAVVPYTEPAIDDSYFRDAVFIGDSRMEGFRNTSGITQGTFMTSVGMSLSSIADTKVSTPDGEITVYQGLSGRQYGKIYLMLGTNDLGYYPWDAFQGHAEEVLEQFHNLQPNAIIYVCGVIYVEGQKISTEYVNNDNVRKVNGYLLSACENLPYCYYLNLNEIFSNGYGALIDGATADGVHLQPQYSSMMLDYLKSHYVTWDEPSGDDTDET